MAESSESDENVQEYVLEADSELRIEVESKNEKVQVELKSGMAELFGTELVRGKKYIFGTSAKIAIFTWQGCTLEVTGKPDVSYVAKETPMTMYLNCHAALEKMRRNAEAEGKRGPITVIVGPCDVGKSTVCRILLNYAVRMGRRPIYVDLDVGQGHISIPGTIGAMLIERPASVDGFSEQAPLVYHFGHTAPHSNLPLFQLLITKMADVISERMQANKKANVSGVIINTCGWVRGQGYKQILNIAQSFEVDVILVLDQERLYNELQRDLPNFVKVVFLPKSRGVVERSKSNRADCRDARVNDYFYGTPLSPLYPHSFDVKLTEVQVYKIGAPSLPDSCMPLGMKPEENKTKLVQVNAGPNLLNHILAVSFAASIEEDVITTNAAGFICVYRHLYASSEPFQLPKTNLLEMNAVVYIRGCHIKPLVFRTLCDAAEAHHTNIGQVARVFHTEAADTDYICIYKTCLV